MSSAGTTLSSNPLIQLKASPKFRAKKKTANFSARLDNSKANPTDPQLNLSVLRFTLGIPGLDESYLPRWIGYGFGSLLLLNHFAGSGSPTLAQLRTEALGLSLAGFSIALPYLGKFLKGATPMDQTSIPEGCEQIFMISETTSNTRKEDLAWATYILLRNTNSISVIISVRDELCVRGYWSIPDDVSKPNVLDWFEKQIKSIGLSNLKETLYLPQIEDSGLWEMLPKGTRSLLVQPVLQVLNPNDSGNEQIQGFVLLASSMRYAYSDKDRAWAGALANKFGGK
ncbi:protein COFACTOR ASSEMBLY OF COMPLEX C SUBUNIT B CCB2, chloroplastic [Rosa rugosa]|uniref:protein COFACTOR ASSEMBLY OF COMPLEX C SUBUNIT B CCB2, chloroplastic n=1 Tax=Rosa rugosa TaxID=74645 RepID=UPI002B415249|nr:protein COFACTOR ASSEMBLY OF COMPLEX C SUBUNIT B CCB2, chloroplastic [Rosa rugosa]XP_062001239.1 protein COFACTOR ASSEMBLY OF COMPLEX C SUBUNIT B CCB2, chloroplastic [Rosa rugosa]XP_062001240.1 protein COFACTOR ASSEMBLY OF COMPLEX C SUBUNIT B CCB2, chloroplastic [Rosa rugosa]